MKIPTVEVASGTLGHQTEEEKLLDDVMRRNSRVRALDTVIQKLQVEIASSERREKHALSDEEVDSVLQNIANPSFVSHNNVVTPGSSSAELKEELFKLMFERDSIAVNSALGHIASDFAARKNPRPSVSPPKSVSVSTASSGKNEENEEDDAHAYAQKVMELVGGII